MGLTAKCLFSFKIGFQIFLDVIRFGLEVPCRVLCKQLVHSQLKADECEFVCNGPVKEQETLLNEIDGIESFLAEVEENRRSGKKFVDLFCRKTVGLLHFRGRNGHGICCAAYFQ